MISNEKYCGLKIAIKQWRILPTDSDIILNYQRSVDISILVIISKRLLSYLSGNFFTGIQRGESFFNQITKQNLRT